MVLISRDSVTRCLAEAWRHGLSNYGCIGFGFRVSLVLFSGGKITIPDEGVPLL